MIVEAGRDWILRQRPDGRRVSNRRSAGGSAGSETPTGAVIFALNIDLPGGMKDAPKREAIVRSMLQSIRHFRAETCGFSWCISPL